MQNLIFRKIDINPNLSSKIYLLEIHIDILNKRRVEALNTNFKYYSQKKRELARIDAEIKETQDKMDILLDTPSSKMVSYVNPKKFKNMGNGVYIQRK